MSNSCRVKAVRSPVIPDVAALIAETPGTISLGQGVVHYPPPSEVFEEIAAFGAAPVQHHYRHATGLPELQEALCEKLAAENKISVGDDQVVVVTAGSNMAFYHALLCIADPEDEVIVLSPFYFNHEMAVVLAGCRAVMVSTDAAYQPCPQRIAAAVTPRTRAVVTISPNNPTGAVYPQDLLSDINKLCCERGVYHICDEAYEYFTYGGAVHFSPGSLPDSASHTISLYSFSKAYNLANWRIGYMVMPQHLLPGFEKVQDTVLICPPVVSQVAALGALRSGRSHARRFIPGIDRVRRMCLQRIADLGPLCDVPPTYGAFYLLARLSGTISPQVVVERLIKQYKVAAIPGSAFGLQGCYLRVSYGALQADSMMEGMDRLVCGLSNILATA